MNSDRRFARVVTAATLAATFLFTSPGQACFLQMACKPIQPAEREAEELRLHESLRDAEKTEGAGSIPYAEACDLLGSFYAQEDRTYDHAELWFRRSVSIMKDPQRARELRVPGRPADPRRVPGRQGLLRRGRKLCSGR
jgi:hypothetical protein